MPGLDLGQEPLAAAEADVSKVAAQPETIEQITSVAHQLSKLGFKIRRQRRREELSRSQYFRDPHN